jgi:hypothetical protein
VQYVLEDNKGGLHVWLFVTAPGDDAWAFTRLGLVDKIVRSVGIAISFGIGRWIFSLLIAIIVIFGSAITVLLMFSKQTCCHSGDLHRDEET